MDSLSPNEEEPPPSATTFRRTGRRTPSFSSSSSASSLDSSIRSSSFSFGDDQEIPLFSPRTPLKFKGVPFSWEQIPGIPKHQDFKKKEFSGHHLPPPPATTAAASKKLLHQRDHDPFFAALVECSKDNCNNNDDNNSNNNYDNDEDDLKGSSKITRTLSDRFGFINMYSSCKRTCAVSESIVYLPRQSSHYVLNRRSS